MTVLQEIFCGYINSDRYKGNDESTGTLKSFDECSKALSLPVEQLKDNMEDKIVSYGTEREELGFINGFRYGVQLMAECMPSKGGASNG